MALINPWSRQFVAMFFWYWRRRNETSGHALAVHYQNHPKVTTMCVCLLAFVKTRGFSSWLRLRHAAKVDDRNLEQKLRGYATAKTKHVSAHGIGVLQLMDGAADIAS